MKKNFPGSTKNCGALKLKKKKKKKKLHLCERTLGTLKFLLWRTDLVCHIVPQV